MRGLKERRKMLGLSQIELAKKIGVTPLTLQLWEREVVEPNETNAKKLGEVLRQLEEEHLNKIKERWSEEEQSKIVITNDNG